ncbi:hypothetical protein, conserved [Eimeria tenella]|uniref:Uncharacterized protein n=1 Tax=Eimeria tenella TaxID=5802 RepID=U6KJI1_EIMTE|nr:hypothetical protein, conserved [Eimeria tenella]CDJ38089.1 hypothetical protein, conserved [Eimeria tenella]|eukprot:XP_013228927.1 hypothetical protein, conserved [Eimeria tenella]
MVRYRRQSGQQTGCADSTDSTPPSRPRHHNRISTKNKSHTYKHIAHSSQQLRHARDTDESQRRGDNTCVIAVDVAYADVAAGVSAVTSEELDLLTQVAALKKRLQCRRRSTISPLQQQHLHQRPQRPSGHEPPIYPEHQPKLPQQVSHQLPLSPGQLSWDRVSGSPEKERVARTVGRPGCRCSRSSCREPAPATTATHSAPSPLHVASVLMTAPPGNSTKQQGREQHLFRRRPGDASAQLHMQELHGKRLQPFKMAHPQAAIPQHTAARPAEGGHRNRVVAVRHDASFAVPLVLREWNRLLPAENDQSCSTRDFTGKTSDIETHPKVAFAAAARTARTQSALAATTAAVRATWNFINPMESVAQGRQGRTGCYCFVVMAVFVPAAGFCSDMYCG